jgi:hypothetical protein
MTSTQTQLLNQLKTLETILKQGSYSDTLVLSLRKIILQEIHIIQGEIQDLEKDLKAFEEQYQLSSEQFYQQFKIGQLGDDIDFVEWSAFYQMWCSCKERLTLLQAQI